jgi:hypothetical protein
MDGQMDLPLNLDYSLSKPSQARLCQIEILLFSSFFWILSTSTVASAPTFSQPGTNRTDLKKILKVHFLLSVKLELWPDPSLVTTVASMRSEFRKLP